MENSQRYKDRPLFALVMKYAPENIRDALSQILGNWYYLVSHDITIALLRDLTGEMSTGSPKIFLGLAMGITLRKTVDVDISKPIQTPEESVPWANMRAISASVEHGYPFAVEKKITWRAFLDQQFPLPQYNQGVLNKVLAQDSILRDTEISFEKFFQRMLRVSKSSGNFWQRVLETQKETLHRYLAYLVAGRADEVTKLYPLVRYLLAYIPVGQRQDEFNVWTGIRMV